MHRRFSIAREGSVEPSKARNDANQKRPRTGGSPRSATWASADSGSYPNGAVLDPPRYHRKFQAMPETSVVQTRIHSNVPEARGVSLDREEALLVGPCHRCGAVRDRQLVEDVDQVCLHGRLADVEALGDLGVGVAAGDFAQHVDLS